MLDLIPLYLVCSARILFDEFSGVPDPNAGFCAGDTGFDCVCPEEFDEINVDPVAAEKGVHRVLRVEDYEQDYETWYAQLEGVGQGLSQDLLKKAPIIRDGKLIDDKCEDKNVNCSWWAEIGECENNPGFLMSSCPKSCNVCRAVNGFSRDLKCVRDPSERPIVDSPGGLNAMFQAIVDNPDFVKRYSIQVLSSSPWVLQFENFAERSDWDELERHLQGQFVGSTVVGKTLDDGTIERQTLNTRTSSNAWCNADPCLRSTAHRKLQMRLAELLGPRVGIEHMESLQVLKYEVGQFYHPHHDCITEQIKQMSGPRMLTAFVYFNDVEGGGATRFVQLGGGRDIQVKPKIGRMVLWPSMKDSDSDITDDRTTHEAMNVTAGRKEAANLWVHLYNYQMPSFMGCAG
eukprot:m.508831 g.508831  ORF g.508831 m.508831 type:complete len:403 (-) comp21887_c1_seq4:1632-2840(-)